MANNLDKRYDPYKAAYGSMPTHAASNQAIQQMNINGHFCYAYRLFLVMLLLTRLKSPNLFWVKLDFKEIINALRQYPWQVVVAGLSLIPLYIIVLKFMSNRKVGLSRKIKIAEERGHVTKGMIVKKDAKRITVNRSNSNYNFDKLFSSTHLIIVRINSTLL